MDKEALKRRINARIDEDAEFASNLGQALEAQDNAWILQLVYLVIGIVIEIGSSIWNWIVGK